MILHLVSWKLKDEALGHPKADNARRICDQLHALRGRIPGLLRLDAGVDFSATANSADVALVAQFATREDLAAYQTHPEHQAVAAFVSQVVCERRLADFEIP